MTLKIEAAYSSKKAMNLTGLHDIASQKIAFSWCHEMGISTPACYTEVVFAMINRNG
jgi:hypothetical protein